MRSMGEKRTLRSYPGKEISDLWLESSIKVSSGLLTTCTYGQCVDVRGSNRMGEAARGRCVLREAWHQGMHVVRVQQLRT